MEIETCPWCWLPLQGETREANGVEVHTACDDRMKKAVNLLGLYADMFNVVNGGK